jgi:hypothetical protein
MFGYILAIMIGLVLVAFVVAALSRAGPREGGCGQHPSVSLESEPAADEPTPDRSVTASPRKVEAARRHTPPA